MVSMFRVKEERYNTNTLKRGSLMEDSKVNLILYILIIYTPGRVEYEKKNYEYYCCIILLVVACGAQYG